MCIRDRYRNVVLYIETRLSGDFDLSCQLTFISACAANEDVCADQQDALSLLEVALRQPSVAQTTAAR